MPKGNKPIETDHIDPRWEEGRDYQLICGRDCLENFNELDSSVNQKKSNCFLPWRWVSDEVGVVPKEPGDLALFLVGADIDTNTPGEWVLMEFLGEDWYFHAKTTSSRSHREVNVDSMQKGQTQSRESNPEMWEAIYETWLNAGRQWAEENPEEALEKRRVGAQKQHAQKWICTVTGKISSPCGLSSWQRARGIDTSCREKLPEDQQPYDHTS